MNIRAFLLCSLIGLAPVLFIACDKSPEPKQEEAPGSGSPSVQAAPAPPQAPIDSVVRVQGGDGAPPPASPQPTPAEGMNPPHGQPGHRCDIPVGAPLNALPGKQPAPPAAAQVPVAPVVAQQAPPPAQAATAPGMNPPHGQPNHRCDIPVGAPLDSPPGKAPQATAMPEPTPVQRK